MISTVDVRTTAARQTGVTLVVVLLILLVVTVLGIGAAQMALLGERSTRYDRDYLVASQAAEAALMDAEFDIRGDTGITASRTALFGAGSEGNFEIGCSAGTLTRGLCAKVADDASPVWATVDFLDASGNARTARFGEFTGRDFDAGNSGIKPERAPRYIIERVEDRTIGTDASSKAPASSLYRITAMGFGPRKEVQVVMQVAFRKE